MTEKFKADLPIWQIDELVKKCLHLSKPPLSKDSYRGEQLVGKQFNFQNGGKKRFPEKEHLHLPLFGTITGVSMNYEDHETPRVLIEISNNYFGHHKIKYLLSTDIADTFKMVFEAEIQETVPEHFYTGTFIIDSLS